MLYFQGLCIWVSEILARTKYITSVWVTVLSPWGFTNSCHSCQVRLMRTQVQNHGSVWTQLFHSDLKTLRACWFFCTRDEVSLDWSFLRWGEGALHARKDQVDVLYSSSGRVLGSVTVESLVWITGHIVGMVEEAANPKHLLPFDCSSLVDVPVIGVHGWAPSSGLSTKSIPRMHMKWWYTKQ